MLPTQTPSFLTTKTILVTKLLYQCKIFHYFGISLLSTVLYTKMIKQHGARCNTTFLFITKVKGFHSSDDQVCMCIFMHTAVAPQETIWNNLVVIRQYMKYVVKCTHCSVFISSVVPYPHASENTRFTFLYSRRGCQIKSLQIVHK